MVCTLIYKKPIYKKKKTSSGCETLQYCHKNLKFYYVLVGLMGPQSVLKFILLLGFLLSFYILYFTIAFNIIAIMVYLVSIKWFSSRDDLFFLRLV